MHNLNQFPGDIQSLSKCPLQVLDLSGGEDEDRDPIFPNFTGKYSLLHVAPKQHIKNFPGLFFIPPHSLTSTPTSPGNIEVFKGMQIKELNLLSCGNLEGECMELGWWGQDQ